MTPNEIIQDREAGTPAGSPQLAQCVTLQEAYRLGYRHGWTAMSDQHHGIPCEQIRHQHETEALTAANAALQERVKELTDSLVGLVNKYECIVNFGDVEGRSLADDALVKARATMKGIRL